MLRGRLHRLIVYTPFEGTSQYLESFNRKERFFLVAEALGKPTFRLSKDFRSRLSKAFTLEVPPDAFAAMDYHLDWIYASLYLVENGKSKVHADPQRRITGSQEDTDLLVAWERDGHTHLMLLEAKVETSWNNKQLRSKAERLRQIFGEGGTEYPNVTPYFGLMSPDSLPPHIDTREWPTWMKQGNRPVWLELERGCERRKVTRCDNEGHRSAEGRNFQVRKRSKKGSWKIEEPKPTT